MKQVQSGIITESERKLNDEPGAYFECVIVALAMCLSRRGLYGKNLKEKNSNLFRSLCQAVDGWS